MAALTIGTILAVAIVCLLLFCPQLLFDWLIKSRSWNSPSKIKEVSLTDRPLRSGRASGNDASRNGADYTRSRRRRSEAVHGGINQPYSNRIIISRTSGSPIVINNNIYINSNDYLQPLPALNCPRIPDPPPPAVRMPRNTQQTSGTRNVQFGSPPNGGKAPQRRRRGESPTPPPGTPLPEQSETSGFWNVAEWARCARASILFSDSRKGWLAVMCEGTNSNATS